ncbi:hypothetical protein O3P69_018583 [Scylla paramamosain]|uniref:Ionotropic glutamate receptor C-terminal domain-containing protein n=1 Tax=Scylla paramamosain TaxID=85552 RepID=A0AAW0T232_SCYPA
MSWEPKKDSARMLAATWLLMSFILGAVYRSNLKAMLIIPKINLPFDNLDELYTSDITIAVVEGASMHLDVVLSVTPAKYPRSLFTKEEALQSVGTIGRAQSHFAGEKKE